MKKIAIVTITVGTNYGNRLQNYALQAILEKKGFVVCTLHNNEKRLNEKIKLMIKSVIPIKKFSNSKIELARIKKFKKFNDKNIKFYNKCISNEKIDRDICGYFDYFVCGSDQIWNPSFKENSIVNFLDFVPKDKSIAIAPSFGVSNIPINRKNEISKYLNNFSNLSVREGAGRDIIKELVGKDATVLVDPTLMLSAEEWIAIETKVKIDKPYILTYFLGDLDCMHKQNIYDFAKRNQFDVINLSDINDASRYAYSPSEFLFLFRKASLILTDSFHACIFSFIFENPFYVFERNDNNAIMNSRIDTLLTTFDLKERLIIDSTDLDLKYDYSISKQILKEKQEIFNNYINESFL